MCSSDLQHLGNPGTSSEVSVDLERRMRTKQVGICASPVLHVHVFAEGRSEQVGQQLVSMLPIVQTRPEVHFPAHRPAGTFIPARFECFACGSGQIGSPFRRNFIGRIQAVQVGDVAMMRFCFLFRSSSWESLASLLALREHIRGCGPSSSGGRWFFCGGLWRLSGVVSPLARTH